MPYEKLSDLPQDVREHLPHHAQEIFQAAFNNAADEYDSEKSAFRVAWAAVKHEYHKNDETGMWEEGAAKD